MIRHIPNFLTLLNLLSGSMGIYFAYQGNLYYAAYAIWVGAVFDFLDGFMARLLKVSSPIGKELDSLADLVTFGLLPAFMMMFMVSDSSLLKFLPLIIVLFAALRLAKFNTDETQSHSFLGMPTPSIAFFVSGLPFWLDSNEHLFSTPVVLITSMILALLMVLPIRMIALKFTNYRLMDNLARYGLLITGLGLFIFLGPKSFPVTISFYLILSMGTVRKKAIN